MFVGWSAVCAHAFGYVCAGGHEDKYESDISWCCTRAGKSPH